ncbi:hypothetical protein [Paucisalibacillus globulus]|uniref:hypothetical protein n=1 Tax=Paucisalibacillus globulus TaxID=351095 RepID=UPI000BB84AB0|nr:hypothetical protein [Paucisalibacillus globulus]
MSRNYKDYERGVMGDMDRRGNEYDNKHDNKHDKHCGQPQNVNNVVDFRWDKLDPNKDKYRERLPNNRKKKVATITFPKLCAGDVVWLNGVVGLESEAGDPETDVEISIFKGQSPVLIDGKEIYRSDFDIDGDHDDETVAPFAHVDVATEDQTNVTYVLSIKAEDPDIFLIGPLTFTGLQLRR